MNYTTSLTGLEFYAYHGLYAEERLIGGHFRVDIKVVREIETPIQKLDEATNYEVLFAIAKEEMAQTQELIETVAQNILQRINILYTHAQNIEVTVHKPNPAGLFKSGEASVTFTV